LQRAGSHIKKCCYGKKNNNQKNNFYVAFKPVPIKILKNAIEKPDIRDRLVTLFNDKKEPTNPLKKLYYSRNLNFVKSLNKRSIRSFKKSLARVEQGERKRTLSLP